MFDDPRKKLQWMEEELLADEEEYDEFDEELQEIQELLDDDNELGPGYNYAMDYGRTIYGDEEFDEDAYVPPQKKRGVKGLCFLAFLEILGILALIGWWVRWLI